MRRRIIAGGSDLFQLIEHGFQNIEMQKMTYCRRCHLPLMNYGVIIGLPYLERWRNGCREIYLYHFTDIIGSEFNYDDWKNDLL